MGDVSQNELQCRLIFLIRLLKVERSCAGTLGARRGESRSLHDRTRRGSRVLDGGARPRLSGAVRRRSEATRGPGEVLLRPPRPEVTRVVDISAVVDKKVEANRANRAKGPGGTSRVPTPGGAGEEEPAAAAAGRRR